MVNYCTIVVIIGYVKLYFAILPGNNMIPFLFKGSSLYGFRISKIDYHFSFFGN